MTTSLGDQIKTMRHERGWTQRELARRSGVSERHIRTLENDWDLCNPSVSTINKLAIAFDTDFIVLGDEEVYL